MHIKNLHFKNFHFNFAQYVLQLLAIITFFSASFPIHADNLILKNGTRYRNVKTQPKGARHIVLFKNGKVKSINNRNIKILRIASVDWKTPANITWRSVLLCGPSCLFVRSYNWGFSWHLSLVVQRHVQAACLPRSSFAR